MGNVIFYVRVRHLMTPGTFLPAKARPMSKSLKRVRAAIEAANLPLEDDDGQIPASKEGRA